MAYGLKPCICIKKAENEPQINVQQVIDAEGQYSQERLRSLTDEWSNHFSSLRSMCNLLKKRKSSFKLNEINKDDLLELCVATLDPDPQKIGEDTDYIRAYYTNGKEAALQSFIAQVLYRVGIVSLKTDGFKEINWSNKGLSLISSFDINQDTLLYIHPMLWRALGINPSSHP